MKKYIVVSLRVQEFYARQWVKQSSRASQEKYLIAATFHYLISKTNRRVLLDVFPI